MSLTSNFLGVCHARVGAKFDGVRSRVRFDGVYEVELTPMKNPVGVAIQNSVRHEKR